MTQGTGQGCADARPRFIGRLDGMPEMMVVASVSDGADGPVSATGIGSTPARATLRHDAERAERLAASVAGGARFARLSDGAALSHGTDGLVRGSAAGLDAPEQVLQRAVFEWVERWLSLRWWAGTLPARQPCDAARAEFLRCYPLRPKARAGLIALHDRGLPPVSVAWSCDLRGRSICFGSACRADAAGSARAAVRELRQMEFGLQVVRHRHRNGIALGRAERMIRARAVRLHLSDPAIRIETAAPAPPPWEGDLFKALDARGITLFVSTRRGLDSAHHVVSVLSPDVPVPTPARRGWGLYGTW